MAIIIKCTRGIGDREAPSISNSLIVTDSMATARGKRYLDDPGQGAYYTTKGRTLKAPHKGNTIIPRIWITVSDSHLGLSSKLLKIKSYSINITPNSVWATMKVDQYETP